MNTTVDRTAFGHDTTTDEVRADGVRSWALDPGAAEQLWVVSEEMVGQTFAY